MSFNQIADYYDALNNLEVYDYWLDWVLESLPGPGLRLLDVACGTGYLTELMAPFFDEIVAVDLDAGMLAKAQARSQHSQVSYIQADMLDLSAYQGQFDLVTCFLDSLNFLEDFDQVAAAIQQMWLCLGQEGVLLFDVWSPWQIQQAFDGFTDSQTGEDFFFNWSSRVDHDQLSVDHQLTLFQEEGGTGLYQRQDLTLSERAYPMESYFRLFDSLGISDDQVEVLVDYGARPYEGDQDQARWFFRLSKGV